jgi:calmodulin
VWTSFTRGSCGPQVEIEEDYAGAADRKSQKAKAQLTNMRELFDKVDTDGGGSLDKKEIKQLVKSMGDRMSAMQLNTAMEKMDPERSGGVTFPAFAKWWKYKQQEYRRDLRKKVREVFMTVDEDGSGVLDKDEVALRAPQAGGQGCF